MITIRPAEQRGHFNHGWLDTYHSFSFSSYYDPEHMGFRSLRVINDDTIEAESGFGTHGHRDMEIITYMLEGELAHRDSTGGGGSLIPGDVQHMTAGRGVSHSEYNESKERTRLLQIWIVPEKNGLQPSYAQTHFTEEKRLNQLRLIAAPNSEDGALSIHQDVKVYAGILEPGKKVEHKVAAGRHAWVQVANGLLAINGKTLKKGDGASLSDEDSLEFAAQGEGRAEFIFFDLA